MTERRLSEVAIWHLLSGLPDNVTDDGIVVRRELGLEVSVEKESLRATIARLRVMESEEVQNLARLAAGYLLAGDMETARRYVARAALIVAAADAAAGSGQGKEPGPRSP